VVALEHVVERRHLALEIGDAVGVADDHTDEGRDVEAEPTRVEQRAVAENDPGRFELLDALEDGGSREPDRLADARERRPAVVLEEAQDLKVGVVQLGVRVCAESHKVQGAIDRTSNRNGWVLSMVC